MGSDKKHKIIGSRETTRDCELDHERLLVTVILGSLSERHWPLDMEIVGAVVLGQKLRRSTQIFISLTMVESMSLIHPWKLWNVLRNKDCPWRTGEASHRTDSLSSQLPLTYQLVLL
jgi:hypothetical protein